jgi:hypothetical protein
MHRSVEDVVSIQDVHPMGMHPYRMQIGGSIPVSTERCIPMGCGTFFH